MLSFVLELAPYAASTLPLTVGIVVRALTRRTPATRFENTRGRAVRGQMKGKLTPEQLRGVHELLDLPNPYRADGTPPPSEEAGDEPSGGAEPGP